MKVFLFLILLLATHSEANDVVEKAKQQTYEAIDVHPMRDGMSHWRKRYGRDRNDPMFANTQIVHIAENMLAYQMLMAVGLTMWIGRRISIPIQCERSKVSAE